MVGALWTERKEISWLRWMRVGVFGLFKTVASFPVARVALLLGWWGSASLCTDHGLPVALGNWTPEFTERPP
jgi:hypothetical protein